MPCSNWNAANYCCSTHPKMLELRATVARARLCAKQGERQKAFDMLSPIYGWFAEGLATPDLLQARMLLSELR